MTDELIFRTRQDFRDWLSSNSSGQGVWLIFGKDESLVTLTASEALEEALCFGWIDGLLKKIDESTYKKYFSPRRKGSPWSEKNKKLVDKLIGEKLMTHRGLEAIEQAKRDGQWDIVRDRAIPAERYDEFEKLIRSSKLALENFRKMPKSARQQFVGLYFEAKKEETRVRRLAKLIGLLEQNKKPM
ncbi:MAG: YdeI/OmpD-associated family protein [Chloroflexota bacterium]